MRLFVTGAAGMLGGRVVAQARELGHEAVGSDIDDLDLTDAAAVRARLADERPDAVIVATGSHSYIPLVPGSDGKHVVTDRDVLGGEAKVGANVVVVDDVHTEAALSTAELLLDQGKRVEVISALFYVGQDVGVTSIAPIYSRLFTKGVVFTPCVELRAIEGSTVVIANVYSGAERRIVPFRRNHFPRLRRQLDLELPIG